MMASESKATALRMAWNQLPVWLPGKLLCALLVGSLSSCGDQAPKAEGETHWLQICQSDADCGGAQCICNLCSGSCRGDDDCTRGQTAAQCFDAQSPGVAQRCPGVEAEVEALCLATCGDDADCASGQACRAGACLAADSVGLPGLDPRDFLGSDAAVDLGRPPVVPEPRRLLEGYYPELEGEWLEEFDGEPVYFSGPMRLSIGSAGDGQSMVGEVVFDGPSAHAHLQTPTGPLPEATDRDQGYPVGVGEEAYRWMILGGVPRVPYPILDARYGGGVLDFWISPADLWSEWCELQTSYLVTVDGKQLYRCVGQDAVAGEVEAGKWLLCTGVSDDRGNRWPPVCTCAEDGCRSASYMNPWHFSLSLDADRMTTVPIDTNGPFTNPNGRHDLRDPFHLLRMTSP